MSENEVLDFDITERTLTVKISGQEYVLHEASEEAAAAWRTASAECAEYDADGKVKRIRGIGRVQAVLVAACLTQESKPVSAATVGKWPSRVVKPLFEKVKEISDLNEVPETAEDLVKQIGKLQAKLDELNSDPN
jgi:hypothetical protein